MEEMLGGVGCGFFDSRGKRGWGQRSPARVTDSYELELFSEGEGISYIGEARYEVRAGMLLCAKPGQVRYSELPIRCLYIRIPAGDTAVDRVLSGIPDVTYLGCGKDYEQISEGFHRLIRLGSEEEPPTGEERFLCMMAALYDVLYRCVAGIRRASDPREGGNRLVQAACEYMDRHYMRTCTLHQVAEWVHVSPNHLHALFRREMRMTPLDYIMRKRVAMAKRLIEAGEATLLEIALGTGFCSQSHFNRIFREKTGETPAAYRRRMMDRY